MRRRLWRAFRAACVRLGLPIPSVGELLSVGKDRFRLEYFVQAGPLNCDLPALADAFIAGREQAGDFDPQDPTSCRNALEAARAELGEGAKTLQRVLANDRGAWHASAFARLSRGEPARSHFEQDFRKAIDSARFIRRAQGARRRPAAPRIVFSEGGVALRSPAMAGWTWTIAGPWTSDVMVGPDQDLPLGGVTAVRWSALSIETTRETAPVSTMEMLVWGDARLLVFDAGSGALLARMTGEACEVAAETVDVVSRERFRLSGARGEQSSDETLEGLHVVRLSANAGSVSAETPSGSATLTLLARPTLSWGSGSATVLQGRPVFGAAGLSLILQLPEEERQDWSGRIEAVVTIGRREVQVRHRLPFVEVDGELVASLGSVAINTFERLDGRVNAALSATNLSTEPFLWSAKDVWVRRYKSGAPRDIAHDFRFVRDAGQTTVLIRDPYALAEDGHDDNLEETAAFLAKLIEVLGTAPNRIEVMARQDKYPVPGAQARKENRLRTLLGGKIELKVKLVDGMRMEFHDRWVEVRPANGGLHRFEVTAGVDRYMRSRSECAIIHVFQPAEPPAPPSTSPGLPPVPKPRQGSRR
jgi:hypothetical protein